MNKEKIPVIVDLCKIGWVSWFIISALIIFCTTAEGSAYLTMHIETENNIEPNTQCGIANGTHACWIIKGSHTVTSNNQCYKGILDEYKKCVDPEFANSTFPPFDIIFFFLITVNILNFYLLFVALNRKYGKYEFKLKKCDGDFI